MKIAFVAFDDLTALDLVGIYDPLTRLKTMGFREDLSWDLCALRTPVTDDRGLALLPSRVGGSLAGYDLLVVPGGYGTRPLCKDVEFLAWLGTAAEAPLKASVCTGALLLGGAGFLCGRRATTHPTARDALAPWCQAVVEERIVEDRGVITAGGVTAAIDLGLYLCAKLAGETARSRIKKQMDYPYGP